MELTEPVKLRPHHIDIISTWLGISPPEKPIYEQPEKLLHFFGENSYFYAELLRYLSNHRNLRIEVVVKPDLICGNCPGYNPAQNVCNRHYDGEDRRVAPEEFRVKKDHECMIHYDLGKLKTIDDIFKRKHWKR